MKLVLVGNVLQLVYERLDCANRRPWCTDNFKQWWWAMFYSAEQKPLQVITEKKDQYIESFVLQMTKTKFWERRGWEEEEGGLGVILLSQISKCALPFLHLHPGPVPRCVSSRLPLDSSTINWWWILLSASDELTDVNEEVKKKRGCSGFLVI